MTLVSALAVDCAAVDFDLSSDQEALRDASATLLDRLADHDSLRARVGAGVVVGTLPGAGTETAGSPEDDAPSGFDDAVWTAMVDQGWLALEIPEEEGGLGLGMVEVAVLCEQIGRRLVAAPYLPSLLALGALCQPEARAENDSADMRLALSEGGAVGCVAFAPDPDCLSVGREGSGVVLSGHAPPTIFAHSASVAVVATLEDVFVVDLQAHGHPPAVSAMDRTRELGILSFERTPALHIGGPTAAALLLDRAATAISAEMLGAADRVLSMSVDYAKDRVQFGKPIGSFQAVKHMLADALVDVEGMRSTVYYGAWCTAADDRERSLAASMAKSWCSDASRRVMATGLQVHGGIGFTWEHDMHLFVKRAQLDQVSFGDAAFHRERIAGLLNDRLRSGKGIG
ncbi:MAG TPA: acyl-CoA dehydrogenase family protein [Acidimicrobiales bacterium]|nr:acyl-CoA dehydrogenase family protein [Acidimicrobiales bacterium]